MLAEGRALYRGGEGAGCEVKCGMVRPGDEGETRHMEPSAPSQTHLSGFFLPKVFVQDYVLHSAEISVSSCALSDMSFFPRLACHWHGEDRICNYTKGGLHRGSVNNLLVEGHREVLTENGDEAM